MGLAANAVGLFAVTALNAGAGTEGLDRASIARTDGDLTVYLYTHDGAWIVSLGATAMMVCADGERAFRYGCALRRTEDGALRRFEIHSGPSASRAFAPHHSERLVVE